MFFFIVIFGHCNLRAAPAFIEACNTLYINWHDNLLRSSDFHDEILHSIENDDVLFLNQLSDHKVSKDKKMMFSAAHIKEAVARNRYDILNRQNTTFTPSAINDDAPLIKALDVLNNKVAQDIVAQEASFFIGNVLQQKKSYSALLLQKISDACTTEKTLQYLVRHLHDVQSNLEACVRDSQENEEWRSRSCILAIRYAALNSEMVKNMFRESITPELHGAFLTHCKQELRHDVPYMTYEDKKKYVDNRYDELSKIISPDQERDFLIDVLTKDPEQVHNRNIKQKILECASRTTCGLDIITILSFGFKECVRMVYGVNIQDDSSSDGNSGCSEPNVKLDPEVVRIVRSMPISEEEYSDAQAAIQAMLEQGDFQEVETIFTLCPSLANRDIEEINRLREEIRQKYEIFRAAWTFYTMSEKHLVELGQDRSKDLLSDESFFNRILGHVAYGLTKSKICNFAVDNHNPFVQQVFGEVDGEHEHNAHWDQESIRAASAYPVVLKATLKYLDVLIGEYQKYNNRVGSQCPICFESYNALGFKGNTHRENRSDISQPQKKIAITYCDENHAMCVVCCNNSDVNMCPICRKSLDINTKIRACQKCTIASTDLRFVHCKDCDSVGVLCNGCTQKPCCRQEILPSDPINEHSIRKYVDTIIEKLEVEHAEFVRQQNDYCMSEQSALMITSVQESMALVQKLKDLEAEIEILALKINESKKKLESHAGHIYVPIYTPSYTSNIMISDYNRLVDVHNAHIAALHQKSHQHELIRIDIKKEKERVERKMARIAIAHNDRIKQKECSLSTVKNTLSGMIKA